MPRTLPVHDPGRVNLGKALRAAVLLPVLLAIGMGPLDDAALGLFASFGAFAVLAVGGFDLERRSTVRVRRRPCARRA